MLWEPERLDMSIANAQDSGSSRHDLHDAGVAIPKQGWAGVRCLRWMSRRASSPSSARLPNRNRQPPRPKTAMSNEIQPSLFTAPGNRSSRKGRAGLEQPSPAAVHEVFDPARLAQARSLLGMTKRRLADELGVTPAAVSQYESSALRAVVMRSRSSCSDSGLGADGGPGSVCSWSSACSTARASSREVMTTLMRTLTRTKEAMRT
ncbi:helix-turn-helix domain-containing protein [Streptomyces phaeochromogenes]|uniref:helix-turn-helix domain-containing protein n=1 Tax=Streptomyces phaeochromogenes TaxID=1923 RepID=UPI003592F434